MTPSSCKVRVYHSTSVPQGISPIARLYYGSCVLVEQALLRPLSEPSPSGSGDHPQLLADHPVRGGLLRVPGLQELLGDALQIVRIGRGVDRAAEALNFEALADRKFQGARWLKGGRLRARSGSVHHGINYVKQK